MSDVVMMFVLPVFLLGKVNIRKELSVQLVADVFLFFISTTSVTVFSCCAKSRKTRRKLLIKRRIQNFISPKNYQEFI